MTHMNTLMNWFNRSGYVQKDKTPFTQEALQKVLSLELITLVNTDFSQDVADACLRHLLKMDSTSIIYTYNDARIVLEQVKTLLQENTYGITERDIDEKSVEKLVGTFSGDIFAVKLRYSTSDVWKSEMIAVARVIAQSLLQTPLQAYEKHNANTFAILSSETARYTPKTPFFALATQRCVRPVQALLSTGQPSIYSGVLEEVHIVNQDLERNVTDIIVKIKGEPLLIVCTPTIMYCATTGDLLIANGRAVPQNLIPHPFLYNKYHENLMMFANNFTGIYRKSVEYIDAEVAISNPQDLKRLQRIGVLLGEATKTSAEIFVSTKPTAITVDIHGRNGVCRLEITPTYILDVTNTMLLYTRAPQMTQTEIETKLQKNLVYYPKFPNSAGKIIYDAFIKGYDLRRKVAVK